MIVGFRSVVFLYIVTVSTATINFCDKTLCIKNGGPHVCCVRGKNRNGFDPSCEKPELVTVTRKHQALILELSNEIRQTVASGKLPRHEPAKKMSVMSYSSELADIAKCNVLRCEYGHDVCRNSPTHNYVGQNLYINYRSKTYMDVEELIRRGFKVWIDESKDSNMRLINLGQITGIGHFTQCVHDRASLVGCAIARFKQKGNFVSYLACDYDETNFEVVYASGPKGSDCKNGHDEKYPALCKTGEKYPTIEEVAMAKAVAKAKAVALAQAH